MKPGYDVQHLKIKERVLPPDAETSEIAAMPLPLDWGVEIPRPTGEGNYLLIKGSIVFQRYHTRLTPQTFDVEEDDDDIPEIMLRRRGDGVHTAPSRPLLPEQEQAYRPDPRPVDTGEEYDDDLDIDDYRTPEDAQEIYDDLVEQNKSAIFRIAASSMICVFLLVMEVIPAFSDKLPAMLDVKKSPVMYLIISLVLFVTVMVLQRHTYISGFRTIAEKRVDCDTIFTITSTFVFVQIVAELIAYGTGHNALAGAIDPVHRVYAAPVVLACIINDVALLLLNRRIGRNLRAIAPKKLHYAAMLCQDDVNCPELMSASGKHERGVVYRVKSKFLNGFMRYSYEQDMCETRFDRFAPYVLVPAVFAFIVGFISGKSFFTGLSCFCAAAVAAVPACRLLCSSLPLYFSCSKLLGKGVMLSGWAGVDEFGSCSTFAVSASDLFPTGSVRFVRAATYSNMPVEEIVLYAASLAIPAGGPLADVLDEEIGHQRHMLYDMDHLTYESELGLSGYVNSRSVIVGTREMLEDNGIELPGKDFQNMRMARGNHMIYIAIGNRFAGVLALEYSADERTEDALQALVREGISILVCTRDPNVTTSLISNTFGISRRSITVLGIRASNEYESITNVVRGKVPAVMSVGSDLASFADGVRAAGRMKRALKMSTLLQLICYTFGILIVTGICCMSNGANGAIAFFPAKIILIQFLCLAASFVGLLRSL